MNVCVIVPFTSNTEEHMNSVIKSVGKLRHKDKSLYVLGIDNNSSIDTKSLDVYFDGLIYTDYYKTIDEVIEQGIDFAIEEGFDFIGWNDSIQIDSLDTSYLTLSNGSSYYGVHLS